MNIWFLTEEKPKVSTIISILEIYKSDFGVNFECNDQIRIKPLNENGIFKFTYEIQNIQVENIEKIYIKTVSGTSSFLDYLLFVQQNEPDENGENNLILGVEETKTSGAESRNTNAYQRGTKFIYFRHFYPNIPAYMLYNDELEEAEDKTPTDTEVFGTRALMTLGVKYVGKKMFDDYKPFTSIDELITSKNSMAVPPSADNVPVRINKDILKNTIYISGTLSKPKDKGNIGHDPNMGCLSTISAAIRHLGWTGELCITRSGVKQSYIDSAHVVNKFLYVCVLLNITIQNITLKKYSLPEKYWHYERSSEKIASIYFHVCCEYINLKEVYQNHAGCERGYFKTSTGSLLTLPKYCGDDDKGQTIALKNKKTKANNKRDLLIPDVIIRNDLNKTIYLIEGKKLDTIEAGLHEIEDYADIEFLFINKYYPQYKIKRYLTIFGGKLVTIPNPKVLLYINDNGEVFMNSLAEAEMANKILNI